MLISYLYTFFPPTSFLFTSLNLEAVRHGSRLYVELGLALLRNTSPVGNWGFASVIYFIIVLVKGLEGKSFGGSTLALCSKFSFCGPPPLSTELSQCSQWNK